MLRGQAQLMEFLKLQRNLMRQLSFNFQTEEHNLTQEKDCLTQVKNQQLLVESQEQNIFTHWQKLTEQL
ncbi:hypothetical protein D3C87_1767580 [compost metagenome]